MSDHTFTVQPSKLHNSSSKQHRPSSAQTEQDVKNEWERRSGAAGGDIDSLCEPIAIIGLATKFPGDAVDTESFWETLIKKRSALTRIPENRYNADAFVSAIRKLEVVVISLLMHL
jgi:hypothetical protein